VVWSQGHKDQAALSHRRPQRASAAARSMAAPNPLREMENGTGCPVSPKVSTVSAVPLAQGSHGLVVEAQRHHAALQKAGLETQPDGDVRVGRVPGSRWQYSGGGFALLQLIIEEVTHDRFAHSMQQTVLEPLGMAQSTFDGDLAMARGIAMSYAGSSHALPLQRRGRLRSIPTSPILCGLYGASTWRRRSPAGSRRIAAGDASTSSQ
jgi:CubicO group peptidase (beta-lactamase class C family)